MTTTTTTTVATVTDEAFAALAQRVRVLTDRADITGLIDGYLLSLDTVPHTGGRFDEAWARRHFTPDVRITTPVGEHQGIDGLAESEQATLAKFERTQHVGANYMIDLDGDRAAVRWNAVMAHVHPAATQRARNEEPGGHFDVGGTFTGEAVRTPGGWRLRSLEVRAVWTSGTGPLVLTPRAEETLRGLAGGAC
ncbi:nuclear transport factor 2 family protein [Kitasatospora sp. NPDC056783]|uniref:nuclear transport factor 2 family protein n=1 Tax=Kitasatospora sp. NPDC056783 TaxID=3345943 RepID=UPI0036A823EF